jgi:acetolactate synthase-1/3 small subunit
MGMVRQWQQLLHGGRYSHSYSEALPDFVKLAEAYGAVGIRATKPEELDDKIKDMISINRPVLFDCVVDQHENCFPMIPSGAAHNEMILGDAVGELVDAKGKEIRTTLSVLVDNEAGVLARVIGLFSGRGYNIESLTVAEVDHLDHTSRITIVTSGTPEVLEQIRHQLERLVPVHKVVDLSTEKPGIEREMALIKVSGTGDKRVEAMRLSEVFRARIIDTTHSSFVFELTGNQQKIDAFVDLMKPLGLVEVSRTGVVAISRGGEAM